MSAPAPLRWGVLATGGIALQFARSLRTTGSGTLVAVASRTQRRADAFAAELGSAVRAHGSYRDLVDDPDVDAIYIATPHPQHAEWAIHALRAGKAVLCEKPLSDDPASAREVVRVARQVGGFLMEALMYRFHPQTRLLCELLADGAIGELRLIRSSFTFAADVGPEHRLRAPELAGGGILDVGGYPVSLARLLAGAAVGRPPLVPTEVRALGRRDATGVDATALALLAFDTGALAQVGCAIDADADDTIELVGSAGRIVVPTPCWEPGLRDGGTTQVVVTRAGRDPETIRVPAPVSHYALEADEVARHLGDGESPTVTLDDTLATLDVLEAWARAF